MHGQAVMTWLYRIAFWGAVLVAIVQGFENNHGGIVLAILLVGHRLANVIRSK